MHPPFLSSVSQSVSQQSPWSQSQPSSTERIGFFQASRTVGVKGHKIQPTHPIVSCIENAECYICLRDQVKLYWLRVQYFVHHISGNSDAEQHNKLDFL